jgi:hypothetical protein
VAKIIACACLLISATLAGLYGYMSADTVYYGAIRAASLCAVAVVGACCPAWASQHWSGHGYGQCALTWLVCAVCLAVTLGGGIGTIAGGADRATAERARASDAATFNKGEFARITAELTKLPDHRPPGTVRADIEAFRAGRAYKSSNGCDPQETTGKSTRESCDAFRKLEGELETAKAAVLFEGKAATLGASLAKGPAVYHANPQAAAISNLLHIPVDDAVNWYAFVASLALELAAIAVMMHAEGRPASRRSPNAADRESPGETSEISEKRVPPEIRAALPQRPRPTAGTTLVDPTTQLPGADTAGRFMLACLKRAPGEEAPAGEIYVRYQRWCSEQQPALAALDLRAFAQQFAQRCERVGIHTRRDGHRICCLDVKLAA